MDTFEIRDDDIDVEEIMSKIKDNIKKRRENGTYNDEMDAMINTTVSSTCNYEKLGIGDQGDFSSDLDYLKSNCNLHAEYHISSHRRFVGLLLVRSRKLIHGEVKRYVDILSGKQTEFNARIVRLLDSYFKVLDDRVDQAIETANENIATVNENINTKINETYATVNGNIDTKVDEAVTTLNKNIDTRVYDLVVTVDNDLENKAWLSGLLDNKIQKNIDFIPDIDQNEVMNYFIFEDKFRGSCEDIKQRQSKFIKYFDNCQNIIDIGCGRGEFLSLLKENNINAKGIDLNEDMVLYCQKNGLDVIQGNALSYLQSVNKKSLDGVFLGQVVEHLQPDELISLIKMCYDKMKFGTYFIAETVNPTCLSVFAASFYIDLSHVKPIHPATIKFLMESVGFRDIEFKFFSPFPDDDKLTKFAINGDLDDASQRQIDVMNNNIDKLNALLFGYQDYAIIGKK
ncbi:MAG: class I SAM-dependent methyltransferase [Desulfobacula sp.]|nr:class I SAM-dependent methyltransferase [Desulfobacula sp.]